MTPNPFEAIARLKAQQAARDATRVSLLPPAPSGPPRRDPGTISAIGEGNLVMGLLDRRAPAVHDAIRAAQRGLRGLLRPRGETGQRAAQVAGLLGLSDPLSAIDGPARAMGVLGRIGRAADAAGEGRNLVPFTRAANPHTYHRGWTPASRYEAFNALPDDAPVWVFHATDDATADAFLRAGVDPANKPGALARSRRIKEGQYADFGPGKGLSGGLYVGSDPMNVEGYGRRILAIQVPRRAIRVAPEQAALGKSVGEAIGLSDAVVLDAIPSSHIIDVTEAGRFITAEDALRKFGLAAEP